MLGAGQSDTHGRVSLVRRPPRAVLIYMYPQKNKAILAPRAIATSPLVLLLFDERSG